MLVLSRKSGESIVLPGSDVTITVVRVSGNRVRLGITAPSDVVVHREEIWRQQLGDTPGPTRASMNHDKRQRLPR